MTVSATISKQKVTEWRTLEWNNHMCLDSMIMIHWIFHWTFPFWIHKSGFPVLKMPSLFKWNKGHSSEKLRDRNGDTLAKLSTCKTHQS